MPRRASSGPNIGMILGIIAVVGAAAFGGKVLFSKKEGRTLDGPKLDMRAAVVNDNWTFALVGKNVTNTKFLAEVIPAPEFGGDFAHPGTERRLSFEVGYKF